MPAPAPPAKRMSLATIGANTRRMPAPENITAPVSGHINFESRPRPTSPALSRRRRRRTIASAPALSLSRAPGHLHACQRARPVSKSRAIATPLLPTGMQFSTRMNITPARRVRESRLLFEVVVKSQRIRRSAIPSSHREKSAFRHTSASGKDPVVNDCLLAISINTMTADCRDSPGSRGLSQQAASHQKQRRLFGRA